MRVVRPIEIAPAMLVLSSVPALAPGEVEWAAGQTIAEGDERVRGALRRTYVALTAQAPTSLPPEADEAGWEEIGATRRWAAFDLSSSSQSLGVGAWSVTVAPGAPASTLALFGLLGASVRVVVVDPAGAVVFERREDLAETPVTDWFSYFFEPFRQRETVLMMDLPALRDCRVTVTITGTGTVGCGGLVLGQASTLGQTYGVPSVRLRSYSRVVTGKVAGLKKLRKGRTARIADVQIRVGRGAVNAAMRTLRDLDGTPAVFIGDPTGFYESLTLLGVLVGEGRLTLPLPQESYIALQIEELA